MIPKECKRLAEVDFPIAVVSRYATHEKLIRDRHPAALHLWWARRPLAACRAMLLALLLPDPCDPHCPPEFKASARRLLPTVQGRPGARDDDLRQALLKFIGEAANWDLSTNPAYLDVARGLVHGSYGDEPPLVVDPFAGGGSIPLEALRLGCDAFASDLNPVACLILQVLLEDIPRHGPALAEELRRVGGEIKDTAAKELARFYPPDPGGMRPIAYLWARTILCESPNCGAEVPLIRSFWLSKRSGRKRALRCSVVRPRGQPPRIEFEIFEPASDSDVRAATVSRAKATCLACHVVLGADRVRAQLAAQRGGADVVFDANGRRAGGARMLAVVTLPPGGQGRHYRVPTERDYEAVGMARERLGTILEEWACGGKRGLCPVPGEPLPPIGTLGFRVQRYGMVEWGDLFTTRQKLALVVLTQRLSAAASRLPRAVSDLIALAIGKTVDLSNAGAPWKPDRDCPVHLLSSQKIPPLWDWAEAVVTAESSGSFWSALERSADSLASLAYSITSGSVACGDATDSKLPSDSTSVWFTDPPYYDAIPYSDLSDFFFVWLKRSVPDHLLLGDPFDPANPLTPKAREAVQDETKRVDGKPKDRAFFEHVMARAFAEGRRVLRDDGIGSVVFAHKTTEGWEALLSGMIRGG